MTARDQSLPFVAWPAFDQLADSATTREQELIAILTLLCAADVGSRTVWRLAETFTGASAALAAPDSTLEQIGGLQPGSIEDVRKAQAEGFGEKQLARAEKAGARLLLAGDEEYPRLLTLSHSPPAILFALGQEIEDDGASVAVVGSRRAGEPGLEIAHQIGAGLAKAGVAVVSGLALGVDGAAHRGALQENGPTVAVLGCGVDRVYPPKHKKLRDELLERGTVVSELFMGAAPEPRNFPMRNRIIAWMSAATVVVEASARSGALITAALALQENRDVFAVPGHPLSPGHEGSNHLLKNGAGFVRHAGDIIEAVGASLGVSTSTGDQQVMDLDPDHAPVELSDEERTVYRALDPVEKVHSDRLAARINIDTSRLGVLLLGMELRGAVKRLPGDHYLRVPGRVSS